MLIQGAAEGCVHLAVALAILFQAASSGGTPYRPTLPFGILVAWLVCNGRKRNPIGGWLLFYYWQLYGGLLASAAFFALNIQSYVPENFDNITRFGLFLASAVPTLVLFVFQCAVATLLLSTHTWDLLKLLRWVMMAEIGAAVLGAAIDTKYFPENLVFSFLTIVPALLWLAYFFRSARVRHVFCLHDWDVAVDSIYPPKLRIAT